MKPNRIELCILCKKHINQIGISKNQIIFDRASGIAYFMCNDCTRSIIGNILVKIINDKKQILFRKFNEIVREKSGEDFIISSATRSGTSLLCELMNRIENVVCLNEVPEFYHVPSLKHNFSEIRRMLYYGAPIPMNIDSSGKIITDTQDPTAKINSKKINIDDDKPLFIGSKINIPYLYQIDDVLRQGFKVISIIRHPVYAIASWNKHAVINEQYVMPSDFKKWYRYATFDFKHSDKYERQVEVWDSFADIIIRRSSLVISYEVLVAETDRVLRACCKKLGIEYNLSQELPALSNMNTEDRFEGIELDKIREAVKKCSNRAQYFGYGI